MALVAACGHAAGAPRLRDPWHAAGAVLRRLMVCGLLEALGLEVEAPSRFLARTRVRTPRRNACFSYFWH